MKASFTFDNDWFVKADSRYAYGSAKYSGSGTQSNIPYSYYDLRGLFGYDFSFSELGDFFLAPYTGWGYRYLFDNQGCQATSGANSYNRSSFYVYLPISVTHRAMINDAHRLALIASISLVLIPSTRDAAVFTAIVSVLTDRRGSMLASCLSRSEMVSSWRGMASPRRLITLIDMIG